MSIGSVPTANFSSPIGAAVFMKAENNQMLQGINALTLIASADVPAHEAQQQHHDPNSTVSYLV